VPFGACLLVAARGDAAELRRLEVTPVARVRVGVGEHGEVRVVLDLDAPAT